MYLVVETARLTLTITLTLTLALTLSLSLTLTLILILTLTLTLKRCVWSLLWLWFGPIFSAYRLDLSFGPIKL